ncbi:MAG TPA: DNA repair protein RadA [Acidimicrobiales bacterium]|nr:DNA repair protein RadA [Acidimicrobiales bacterium]
MAKTRAIYRCQSCGAAHPKWAGQCGYCQEWNTLVEEAEGPRSTAAYAGPAAKAVPLTSVDASEAQARPTWVGEFDRVLGGGLVPGSVTLLGGEPGIGKSTLTLQLLGSIARSGRRGLLVSAEESPQQVQLRAGRLGAQHDGVWIVAETSMPAILGAVADVQPDLLVVDSIQSVFDPDLDSSPGSVTQVRECAHALVLAAKASGVATILVGHVTKEGALAGPRVLEHVVDTVLSFDGDRHHALRLLRAAKHRFGATGELGLFEMREEGLVALEDPTELLLGDRRPDLAGSCVVPIMEGRRTLLVEVQALVSPTSAPMPRRAVQGIESSRLATMLAVLERNSSFRFGDKDVYVSAVGGVRVNEPAGDLGVAIALASTSSETQVPADVVAIGEVGLGGEIRRVGHMERRLAEAARLGFARAIVPAATPEVAGIGLMRMATLADAVKGFKPRRAD